MLRTPLNYLHKILNEYPELRKYSTFELALNSKSILESIAEIELLELNPIVDEDIRLYLIYDASLDTDRMQLRVFTDDNNVIRDWTDVTIDNENNRVYFTSLINHDDNNNVTP